MIKSKLIQKLAEKNPHLYQRDVERIVSTIFDEISAALSRGDRVELRGFGAFSVKRRPEKAGNRPRLSEPLKSPEPTSRETEVELTGIPREGLGEAIEDFSSEGASVDAELQPGGDWRIRATYPNYSDQAN